MQTTSMHRLLRLGTGELLAVDAAPGQVVVVFNGKVWITQQDDLGDYIVAAGGSFTCDRSGLMLIEALEPASFAVVGEHVPVHDTIGYEAAWPAADDLVTATPAKTRSAKQDALPSYA